MRGGEHMNRRGFVVAAGAALPLFMNWAHFRDEDGQPGAGTASEQFKLSLNQWSLWNDYVGDNSADDWWEVFQRDMR